VSGTGELTGEQIEFVVTGMSCGSCAARIERRLNRLDGVVATVNFATERAYISSTGGRDADELIGVIESVGYQAARPAPAAAAQPVRDEAARMLRWRLAVCWPLAVAVIAAAMVPAAQFPGWQWLSLVLAGVVAVWGGWPLHRAAWNGLGHGAATMDTLVSAGVTASFGWSLYALLFGGADMPGMRMSYSLTFAPASGHTLYLDVAAGVTAAVLTGRYLEARAKRQSGSALTALAGLAAKTVAVRRDGTEQRIPVAALAAGDRFVVRPGEKIAADGVVAEGRSAVDTSLVTGESMPAEVGPDDEVIGGCVSMSGRLVVQATRVGADTLLAQITRLVSQAQMSKAAAQRLADRIAAIFVPSVISVAAAALGFWLGAGLPGDAAWSAAIAVLVVACPCALGLATPTALLAGVGRGAQLGILVKSVHALESAQRVRTVVLDKTGTLTRGTMTVQDIFTLPGAGGAPGADDKEVLLLAGAVEDASEHPIGQAIAREAAARLGSLPPVTDFTSLPGAGVRGTVAGRAIMIGSPQLLAEQGLTVSAGFQAAVAAAESAGHTAVLAGWEGRAQGVLVIADTVKPGAQAAVAQLKRLGLQPVLLTGDNERAARLAAAELGIPAGSVVAGVRPDGKAAIVRQFQQAGGRVAMVGDGVNDAAALAQADLGMAIGTGTDAAIGAADLTLVSGDPASIADAILLARATLRVIRANLAWAFGYNVVVIPLAALGYINPLFAGVAMSASSLIVVTNSLRLRRFQSRRPARTQPEPARPAAQPVAAA
jgi:P-type Cu+ transporter